MEPTGSFPCSQEPATGPYLAPFKSNPHAETVSFKICFNSVLPSSPWSPRWPHAFSFSRLNFCMYFPCPNACYTSHLLYLLFWKFLIVWFSPGTIMSTCSPLLSVLTHPHSGTFSCHSSFFLSGGSVVGSVLTSFSTNGLIRKSCPFILENFSPTVKVCYSTSRSFDKICLARIQVSLSLQTAFECPV